MTCSRGRAQPQCRTSGSGSIPIGSIPSWRQNWKSAARGAPAPAAPAAAFVRFPCIAAQAKLRGLGDPLYALAPVAQAQADPMVSLPPSLGALCVPATACDEAYMKSKEPSIPKSGARVLNVMPRPRSLVYLHHRTADSPEVVELKSLGDGETQR